MNIRDTAGRQQHWETIYQIKNEEELSWHQDDPTRSLELIRQCSDSAQRVIDIGGGSSVLAGRLLEEGFEQIAVLDISEEALERARQRIGERATRIQWLSADVTQIEDLGQFDIWHDRAVFHFLTDPQDRRRYVALAERTVPPGGHLIISTFSLDGPEKCSGLPVQRYGPDQLARQFDAMFSLQKHMHETHQTPWGKAQNFLYAVLKKKA